MLIQPPQDLPDDVRITCYACEKHQASHVCRYKVGELAIQVCLCSKCMKMDTNHLLKHTLGINAMPDQVTSNYTVTGRRQPAEFYRRSTIF